MGKAILIHANCVNPTARGDFVFAATIAKDLINELHSKLVFDINVILVSTLEGVDRFERLYGPVINNHIKIEGTSAALSSLEEFDAVENTVIAFIDANRCKHSSALLIKRILSPDCKFLFVGNVNQRSYSDLRIQRRFRTLIQTEQPGLYDPFDEDDMIICSAGLGAERVGLPTITQTKDLPELTDLQREMLPTGEYGFIYLWRSNVVKDSALIAQYLKLTSYDKYVLVGEYIDNRFEVEQAYERDSSLTVSKREFPQIEYYRSLPNGVMRRAVANAKGALVVSTGIISTFEAMQDRKLTYYQDLSNNTAFVSAYLVAVKSIISDDGSLFGIMPQMIIELANLLFADKPLNKIDMERTQELTGISSVCSRLIDTNQLIIQQANGRIAPKLLSFLNASRSTQAHTQLASVCASLRRDNEIGSPVYDQALRRAAFWGRLFELKVLIKAMLPQDMDKQDAIFERTALHQAVINNHLDCARALVKAGVSLNIQDKRGKTALHIAVTNGSREIIKLLVEGGALLDISDKESHRPPECAPDDSISLFVRHCHEEVILKTALISTVFI